VYNKQGQVEGSAMVEHQSSLGHGYNGAFVVCLGSPVEGIEPLWQVEGGFYKSLDFSELRSLVKKITNSTCLTFAG
jgi:hypothetical protein